MEIQKQLVINNKIAIMEGDEIKVIMDNGEVIIGILQGIESDDSIYIDSGNFGAVEIGFEDIKDIQIVNKKKENII